MLPHRSIHLLGDDVWPDIGSLVSQRAHLRRLRIDAPVRDLSSVNELVDLEELSLGARAPCGGTIDLGRLPRLRHLAVEGHVDITAAGGGKTLEYLFLSRPGPSWNDILPSLPHLRSLVLLGPHELPRAFPAGLRSLEISYVSPWPRGWKAEGVDGVTELRFTNVRGMTDLRSFSAIRGLRTVFTDDSDELVSTDGPVRGPGFQERHTGRGRDGL